MNGLPADTDLSFMVGKTLDQICVDQNAAILKFSGDVSLSFSSKFRIVVGSEDKVFDDILAGLSMLGRLIAAEVRNVRALPSGTIALDFGDSLNLEVYDSFSSYESYQLRHGSVLWVV